jgi:Xaa-Pro aminopeptidase
VLSNLFDQLNKSIKRNELYLVNKNNSYLNSNQWPEENALFKLISYPGSNGILTLNIYEKILWIDPRYLKSATNTYKDSRIQIKSQNENGGLKSYIENWANKQQSPIIKLNTKHWNAKQIEKFGLICDPLQIENYEFLKENTLRRRIDFDNESDQKHPYIKKLELIQKNIKSNDIHLISNPEDISWILNIRATDFPYMRSVKGKMILAKHFAFLFSNTNAIQSTLLKKAFLEIKIFNEESLWVDTLKKILNSKTPTSIHYIHALRPGALNYYDKNILNSLTHNHEKLIANDRSLIEKCRVKKVGCELKVLRSNGETLSTVMTKSISWIQQQLQLGNKISELDAQKNILNIAKAHGSLHPCFEPIVASGINSAYPHHIASGSKIINKGELLMLDLGFYFKPFTYASDMTRTFLVGYDSTPTDIQKKVYTEVLKAFLLQYSIHFQPLSIKAKELDLLGRDSIEKANLNDYRFNHSTGHGLGIVDHELAITIGPSSYITLQHGNVYSIEPGVYYEKDSMEHQCFGVRIEDIVQLVQRNQLCYHKSFNYHKFDEKLIDYNLLLEIDKKNLGNYLKHCP